MSSDLPVARKPTAAARRGSPAGRTTGRVPAVHWLDVALVVAFLGLVFLLGAFPLKDTDFWWHLRTGDLIRQTGEVPRHDLYTYTVPDHPWIDLHWGFQVLLSWGYARGGVAGLTVTKCAIDVLAIGLLLSARRVGWPIWVSLLAWIPALLVLSGRMYVRPETLSLLYLSGFLAVVFHWGRKPWLAWALPLIQVAWVNTQGLFVLGPAVLAFAIIDATVRPGAFSEGRRRWWRTVGMATAATGLACLVNPYGLAGALYPLQLARTMGNPVFSNSIAELTPIPVFIRRSAGWGNHALQLHVATMVLGALSFLLPLSWTMALRIQARRRPIGPEAEEASKPKKARARSKKKEGRRSPGREPRDEPGVEDGGWHLSAVRVLLFAAFSLLSWRATRNSHQFAAVVGALTSWNFAGWAASIRSRRAESATGPVAWSVLPRLATLGVVAVLLAAVASGRYYAWMGEGRTVGLGEEPLWYPHEATRFAGSLGMPERFLSFHDGYAALYEYEHGPGRKVFADARLEVIGPELYERYLDLKQRIMWDRDETAWARDLDAQGRPAVLVGHADNSMVGVSLMGSAHWRCVWFDPMVAVYVHDAYRGVVAAREVDFAARHFRPSPAVSPGGLPALLASGKALWHYAASFQGRGRLDLARPLVLAGLDDIGRVLRADPDSLEGWKILGGLESAREPMATAPVPRYRAPFDPVFDLATVRATYALRRALEIAPSDFMARLLLAREFRARAMDESEAAMLHHLIALAPINQTQVAEQEQARGDLEALRGRLGPAPSSSWENLSELDRDVSERLNSGRAGTAADLLERAYPSPSRPWEITDRLATLRLHLGEPGRARSLWEQAVPPPQPPLRSARVAHAALVEGRIEDARRGYREALHGNPRLFEAHYGLAVLERDGGDATAAFREANLAAEGATTEVAKAAARQIATDVAPYARQGRPDPGPTSPPTVENRQSP